MKISLVILVYNEIVGLRQVLSQIPKDSVYEIFAVDGGSKDGSVEFLEAAGIPVYTQTVRGRGEAFRIAFQKAKGDALIFFSPDGNENPQDIPKFSPLLDAGNDMVVANRMTNGGHNEEDEQLLRFRKWANLAFGLMANLTWNRQGYMDDTINGFRAITRKAWGVMNPDGNDYVIEYQCSIRSFKYKLKVAEFPTYEACRLDEKQGSPSIKTGLAFLQLYFRELFH